MVISLVFDIYGLYKMVLDCLWVVVDVFEVVLGGHRLFLFLVTTHSVLVHFRRVSSLSDHFMFILDHFRFILGHFRSF